MNFQISHFWLSLAPNLGGRYIFFAKLLWPHGATHNSFAKPELIRHATSTCVESVFIGWPLSWDFFQSPSLGELHTHRINFSEMMVIFNINCRRNRLLLEFTTVCQSWIISLVLFLVWVILENLFNWATFRDPKIDIEVFHTHFIQIFGQFKFFRNFFSKIFYPSLVVRREGIVFSSWTLNSLW
jgi:hypothetical protein